MRRIRPCLECKQIPLIRITGNPKIGYKFKCFCSSEAMHSPGGEWSESPKQAVLAWNEKQRIKIRENRKIKVGSKK